jgi:type I restriction enzyme S subunit
MSSKTKTTATKEEAKSALVPKLRFPEFRGAEGWKEKRLGNEGEFLSSLTGKAGGDFDVGEARFVTYMNVFSNTFVDPKALRLVDVKEGENQNAVARGDVFFTVSSETPEEVGMSSVLLDDLENCYLNSFCALFRFSKSKRPNPVFTGYLLRQPLVRGYFTKKAQGSTRFNLSKDAFKSLPFFVPSPAEQQKIAECLSSVDELMAAQARKVDALKTHKKGLMQQLFPREGETQPRLRFPEFQNAGEWKETKLGNHVAIQSGYSPSGYALSSRGEYAFVKVEDLNNCIKYQVSGREFSDDSDGVVPTNSILFPKRGAAIELNKIRITATEILIDTNLMALTPRAGLQIEFLYYYLSNVGLSHIADTSTIPQINNKHITPFDLLLPEEAEQIRIASCLSSLDALITAEAQKLEAFKVHKKGLMQRLFPSLKEVKG